MEINRLLFRENTTSLKWFKSFSSFRVCVRDFFFCSSLLLLWFSLCFLQLFLFLLLFIHLVLITLRIPSTQQEQRRRWRRWHWRVSQTRWWTSIASYRSAYKIVADLHFVLYLVEFVGLFGWTRETTIEIIGDLLALDSIRGGSSQKHTHTQHKIEEFICWKYTENQKTANLELMELENIVANTVYLKAREGTAHISVKPHDVKMLICVVCWRCVFRLFFRRIW